MTGQFALDAKNAQRFLNVRAGIATLETGDVAFVSNIDASRKFMGVTTAKRAGLWAAVIRRGSLAPPEQGQLYVGLSNLPAVRLRYTDASTGKPANTVLSFGSERQREIVLQQLEGAYKQAVPSPA